MLTSTPSIDLTALGRSVRPGRLATAGVLGVMAAWPGMLGEVTRQIMMDAYIQVTVFVAATLVVFASIEHITRIDLSARLAAAGSWQVPAAAVLGLLPGCGGAIVVVAAHSTGHVRLGAVVAALTATMGDAAFLLLATRPDAAAVLFPLAFLAGSVTGWAVDRALPGAGDAGGAARPPHRCCRCSTDSHPRVRDILFLAVAAPGLIAGLAQILGNDLDSLLGVPVAGLALAGTALALGVWATSSVDGMALATDSPAARTTEQASFIAVWVLIAYLLIEGVTVGSGLDLAQVLGGVSTLLPLGAVLVGLIPGCGPQVAVTALYADGAIPFSALVGNALSNDGDALLPAMALAPRTAILATAITTVPALVVAYALHWGLPGMAAL